MKDWAIAFDVHAWDGKRVQVHRPTSTKHGPRVAESLPYALASTAQSRR